MRIDTLLLRKTIENLHKNFGTVSSISNNEILDFNEERTKSISIREINEIYEDYIQLQADINEYVEENGLDIYDDCEEIKEHFELNDDYFEFKSAYLIDFDKYIVYYLKYNKNF